MVTNPILTTIKVTVSNSRNNEMLGAVIAADTESRRYRLEVIATTSIKDIAAAKAAAAHH